MQIDSFYKFPQEALAEFKELASAAGVKVLEVVTGKSPIPRPKYFVGIGKVEEIRHAVQALKIEVVLFNHELTPAQGRNLEHFFNCRVLDRSEIILDIFAQRAHTFEGKLQVELAQLQHMKTCLVHGWTHLERQKGGIGLRGPGETQLETDRRLIDNKIKNIKKRLEKVINQREQRRRSRHRAAVQTISLVGYTNAGKSTLFNALTQANVYVADQLFATLDPTLRNIELPHIGRVVLADTVGFISDLPHDLIAAFRATLEETRQAELLLHVIDSQHTDISKLTQDVEMVLKEIGADQLPQLQVYNKIDMNQNYYPRIDRDVDGVPKRVWLSAITGVGLNLLLEAITELLIDKMLDIELILLPTQAKLRAQLYEIDAVKGETMDEEGRYVLQIEIQRRDYLRLVEPVLGNNKE